MCCYRLLACHADQSITRQQGAGWKGTRGDGQGAGREGAAWSGARAAARSVDVSQSGREKIQRNSNSSH